MTVVASSFKRARELLLLTLEADLSQYYVNGWFSCVDAPPTSMRDKPVEEAVWIQP